MHENKKKKIKKKHESFPDIFLNEFLTNSPRSFPNFGLQDKFF